MASDLERVHRRTAHSLGRAVTVTAANDSDGVQRVQVKLNDLQIIDGVPVLYQWGFTVGLPVGSDVALLSLAGDRSRSVVVATGNPVGRPKVQPGETMLYDQTGSQFYLRADGSILANPSNGKFYVQGDLIVSGISFLKHVHSGIQRGGADTDPPVAPAT